MINKIYSNGRAASLIYLFLFLYFMFSLTSCTSHTATKDGPPHFYVDETRIANAVPRLEPLAKYGNMPSYRVFGKRYYVMRSSRYYNEVGTASWYGTKFHKHRTSSGEPYNMLSMTAAHRTLPLPTYVEVTNLRNQKKVIVKVNDRGPFACNRIIDLSYVAAKKLGMIGHGTAHVRVRAIDPHTFGQQLWFAKHHPVAPPHKLIPCEVVYLQVGAFRERSNAIRLKERLSAQLSAPVMIYNPSARFRLYRVQVGPIRDSMTVNQITYRLKQLGISSNRIYGA